MEYKFDSIANSLKKAYLKQDIIQSDFDRFILALEDFFKKHNPTESEEHQKNNVVEFLKKAFYEHSNLINTKGRIDIAIYNGNSFNDTVGVLIEAKSTQNRNEMISGSKPGAKAILEAISYYLEESITLKNKDIKHIIITNSVEWYIFDGAEFEKAFYKNSTLIQNFTHHRHDLFGANTTEWFYNYLHDSVLPNIDHLNCTYFRLDKFKDRLNNPKSIDELIHVFKILSPEHLLKKPFANDSNTLDTQFYDELLHLLGLEEVKDSGKKVLIRLPADKRNDGSLLENTIRILKINNSIERIKNPEEFGANEEEQLFSIGLELCITWLNRILFLKLLESQLIKYNDNDYSFKFLTTDKIKDFDELNELFFEVLALKTQDRASQDKARFAKIPYLNSSLFEQTNLEKEAITISSLKARYTLPVSPGTVLKTISGDKRNGELQFQEYLFEFLDAYNFSSVSKATIQQNSKTIINSSVLGLIFEKLNGYKDGSYFTPGYITMYMCREAITLAVVNKFNEKYSWGCNSLADVYNNLEKNAKKLLEYNALINSIRLVDPAVGSGHFLVSALNEFINIKFELGILVDKQGKRLKDYKFFVENDELIILDDNDHVFSYLSPEKVSGAKRDELQKVQETIFNEKRTIIESCLFGVDINPKSVSISRLRLWIELLKFMYYKPNNEGTYELETLPNIDINIKTGNSLISRFSLKDEARLTIRDAGIIPQYKEAVNKYKNIRNPIEKRKLHKEIDNCKSMLKGVMLSKSITLLKLEEKRQELKAHISRFGLYDKFKTKKDEKEFTDKVNKFTEEIQNLEKEVEALNKNPIFSNAFEWRFEFPEILDDKGNFIGFDVVIGNPPYFSISTMIAQYKQYFEKQNYQVFSSTTDIYSLFIEKSIELLKQDGILSIITSNKWMRAGYGQLLRDFLATKTIPLILIDFAGFKVFDSATVDTNILICRNMVDLQNEVPLFACSISDGFQSELPIVDYFEKHKQLMPKLSSQSWVISSNTEQRIKQKIDAKGIPLKAWDIKINYGIKTGFNEAFIIDGKKKNEMVLANKNNAEFIKPFLRGRDIKKYKAEFADLWLINIPKGFTIKKILDLQKNIVLEPIPHYGYVEYDPAWDFMKTNYPEIATHLSQFRTQAENRQDKGDYWWELRACAYLDDFEKDKIIYPDIMRLPKNNTSFANYPFFFLDKEKLFVEATNFFIVGEALHFLMSVLCSKFGVYSFINYYTGPQFDDKGFRYKKIYLEKFPIPQISQEAQQPFVELVDIILSKKEKGEDTTTEERKIDLMVYKLYDLTFEEVQVIDPEFSLSKEIYEKI
ncbi:MAG: class I SAM-dependent DNA methyltransferase [Desulfobulbaceae bacterium]|nr:class I SAM-dependent DNA methyltransferase [Desulfobulbaceae bacterium]